MSTYGRKIFQQDAKKGNFNDKMKMRKRSKIKKSFLLFELLLSLTLLVLLFFPLIKTHFAITNEEIKRYEKMSLAMCQKKAFITIEEMLYENRFHTFDELKKGASGELNEPFYIDFGFDKKKKYIGKYQIIPLEYVLKRSTGERYLIFAVTLDFISKGKSKGSYKSTFLVEEHEKT